MLPKKGTRISAEKGVYSYISFEDAKDSIGDISNLSKHEVKFFSKKISSQIDGIVANVKVHKVKQNINLQGENLFNKEFFEELEQAYQNDYTKIKNELEDALQIIQNKKMIDELVQSILHTHVFKRN
jgi:isocitrate dehydrogenase